MREKYVDEAVGLWFVFGTRHGPDGEVTGVDVNDGQRDVFTDLHPDVADKLVVAQEEFRKVLYDILCKGFTRT